MFGFLKSDDHKGMSLKGLIGFVTFITVTFVFVKIALIQGADFNPELFLYYAGASLTGYGPKMVISLMKIWKEQDTESK